MRPDRPLLGILLMTGFCLLAPMADAVAKVLAGSAGVIDLVLWRFAMQAVLLVPLALLTGGLLLRGRALALSVLRGALHVVGIAAMFLSLRFLPLAEAIAIAYVMPFVALILGRAILGESVGRRRVLASVAGFAGTLLVVQPTFAVFGPPALLPLFVAVVFAGFMLATRAASRLASPVTLQANSGLWALLMCLPAAAFGHLAGIGDLAPGPPAPGTLPLLLTLGLLGTLAHLMMVWALRFAPAATLAPMQYLEIPFAAIIGLLVFGAFPNGLALTGIAVTMAAGLAVIWAEGRSPPAPRPAGPSAGAPEAAPPP